MSRCASCAFVSAYAFERCPSCGASVVMVPWQEMSGAPSSPKRLSDWQAPPVEVVVTKTPFDQIAQCHSDGVWGFPLGCAVLLWGSPGCGKSTWALKLATGWYRKNDANVSTWYFPYEQGVDALVRDADRLKAPKHSIIGEVDAQPMDFDIPDGRLVIVDSIQEYAVRYFDANLVEAARALAVYAHHNTLAILAICHQTKDGDAAGPERLKHDVDVLIEIRTGIDYAKQPAMIPPKVLHIFSCQQKNRFGPLWEKTVLAPWEEPHATHRD